MLTVDLPPLPPAPTPELPLAQHRGPQDTPEPLTARAQLADVPAPNPAPLQEPAQAGATASVLAALATPAQPGGRSPIQILAGALGTQGVVLVGALMFGLDGRITGSITAALDRQATVTRVERERERLGEERADLLRDTEHTKIHDAEGKEVGRKLDLVLDAQERQQQQLDHLGQRVGELQPKRR